MRGESSKKDKNEHILRVISIALEDSKYDIPMLLLWYLVDEVILWLLFQHGLCPYPQKVLLT